MLNFCPTLLLELCLLIIVLSRSFCPLDVFSTQAKSYFFPPNWTTKKAQYSFSLRCSGIQNCHFSHEQCRSQHGSQKFYDLNFSVTELCLGTYECVATKDYCRDSKEPNTPGILFAIDVSYPMIKEGVVQLICANIKSMLADLPSDPYCDKVFNLELRCSMLNNKRRPSDITCVWPKVENIFILRLLVTTECKAIIFSTAIFQLPFVFSSVLLWVVVNIWCRASVHFGPSKRSLGAE